MSNNAILVNDTFVSESTTSNTSSATNELRNMDKLEYIDTELANMGDIKTELFKSLIVQLQDHVETLKEENNFLKSEIIHKNSLISVITSQNSRTIPEILVNEPNKSSVLLENMVKENVTNKLGNFNNSKNLADQNLWSSIDESISEDQSSTDINIHNSTLIQPVSAKIIEAATRQLNFDDQLKQVRELRHYDFLNRTRDSYEDYHYSVHTNNESTPELSAENVDDATYELGPWEKHNRGFASKIMKRMGYNGKGLGKLENGIIKPISVKTMRKEETEQMSQTEKNETNIRNGKKLLYILSSSMLNQMDAKKLSRGDVDVKVHSHGGCTISCMYSHLSKIMDCEPEYILLHIGSNDCVKKTSDEVLNEYKRLTRYIVKRLPHTKIIVSLPIVRADNTRAACIQRNLKCKLQRYFFPCLDNSNVDLSHLGKKGLHLNNHGNKIMARNIISLIKRL